MHASSFSVFQITNFQVKCIQQINTNPGSHPPPAPRPTPPPFAKIAFQPEMTKRPFNTPPNRLTDKTKARVQRAFVLGRTKPLSTERRQPDLSWVERSLRDRPYRPLGEPPPSGASLGLHASGFPSGAQQVPAAVPRGDVNSHACPAVRDAQASSASCGGLRGPHWPPVGWAATRPAVAESAASGPN